MNAEHAGPEPSEWPDMASAVDQPHEILAETFGISPAAAQRVLQWHESKVREELGHSKAEQLGRIVGLLIRPQKNLKTVVRALALAAGLDELNGTKSQAEVARELGCTRALVSHYVVQWADLLELDVYKYRKRGSSRPVFSEKAKEVWMKRKAKKDGI